MDQNPPPTLSCHNCKTVTTDNGQQVWVCENCGNENHVTTPEEQMAQAAIDAATTMPTEPVAVQTDQPVIPTAEVPAATTQNVPV